MASNTSASAPAETEIALPELKLLIDNRWVASESGSTFATLNPSTGEEVCQVAEADVADEDPEPVLAGEIHQPVLA